jgi:type IX secretion system PorP/SprF family membrane protein
MKKIVALLIFIFSNILLYGQVDPHFSQYYVYPSYLNPAITGAFNGSVRVSGIFRNQWGSIANPFSTKGISADVSSDKNVNIGFGLLNQTAGNGGYSYSTSHLNLAYTGVKLGNQGYGRLVFGLQAGLIDRRFNRSRLSFGDQWNPVTGYSASNPTSDILLNNSSTSFDLGAGILFYDADPNKKVNVYFGGSASHLSRPKDKFLSMNKDVLPYRFIGHLGTRITLSETISFTPNAMFLSQGNAKQIMIGSYFSIMASAQNQLLLGANYRFEDALSPYIALTFNTTLLGFSYDVNTSELGRKVNGTNAFEVSISFFKPKKIKTPELDFVCPRL